MTKQYLLGFIILLTSCGAQIEDQRLDALSRSESNIEASGSLKKSPLRWNGLDSLSDGDFAFRAIE